MKEVKVDIKDLENFLNYLQDKVEDCYKGHTPFFSRNRIIEKFKIEFK